MRLPLRIAVVGLMLGLAGCYKSIPSPVVSSHDAEWMALVPTAVIDPQYLPYEVDNTTGEPAGTVVIDTPHRFLYVVEANGKAIRYGVGVGDEAFKWSGIAEVGAKKEWPGWLPVGSREGLTIRSARARFIFSKTIRIRSIGFTARTNPRASVTRSLPDASGCAIST
jgi:hypothetical protein